MRVSEKVVKAVEEQVRIFREVTSEERGITVGEFIKAYEGCKG